MGVAACQRESAQHRRPSRSEHGGAGHLATVAVALEVTGYGNAFRVVLAKTRLLSVDPFERLDEDVRCQPMGGADPTAQIGNCADVDRQKPTNRGDAEQNPAACERNPAPRRGRL